MTHPVSDMSVHSVTAVELCVSFEENSRSRTLRITTDHGVLEMTLYGETGALDLLPQSSDFRAFTKPRSVAA